MISELFLIRSYSTFWKSLFPGGEDYVRLINSALGKNIHDSIQIDDKPQRRALINNVSFSIFEKVINKKLETKDFYNLNSNSSILIKVINEEKGNLSNLRYGTDLSTKISEIDFILIKWLSNSLLKNYSTKGGLTIRPKFKGCGLIFEAEGDILYNSTLTEVKAGDRNFGIHDIRQLYVYLALNYASKSFDINEIELFNPRTGVLWTEYIDVVSNNLAGTPTLEILNEIINFISNNNQSI